MHPGSRGEVLELLAALVQGHSQLAAASGTEALPEVAIFPPFPFLQLALDAVAGTPIHVGAQNIGGQASVGALTGEVTAGMVRSLGCSFVIIGHSERRLVFNETDELIGHKVQLALAAGLSVILCVGETPLEFELGLESAIVSVQLKKGLRGVPVSALSSLTIAYEPVWAVGTGRTATPEQAQAAHRVIRTVLGELYGEMPAGAVRIQYGGSVTEQTISALIAVPEVDGALVGGASLVASRFVRIVELSTTIGPSN